MSTFHSTDTVVLILSLRFLFHIPTEHSTFLQNFAVFSPQWKQARTIWNFNAMCRMISQFAFQYFFQNLTTVKIGAFQNVTSLTPRPDCDRHRAVSLQSHCKRSDAKSFSLRRGSDTNSVRSCRGDVCGLQTSDPQTDRQPNAYLGVARGSVYPEGENSKLFWGAELI